MRRLPLLAVPLLLGGCFFHSRGVPAVPNALVCAKQTLSSLGYHVFAAPEGAETGTLAAERDLPRAGIYRVVGEVTVTVSGNGEGERRLQVEGRRFEEFAPRDQPGKPVIGGGVGSPIGVRVGSSRVGRRALPAGAVAEDAEAVRSRCGTPVRMAYAAER